MCLYCVDSVFTVWICGSSRETICENIRTRYLREYLLNRLILRVALTSLLDFHFSFLYVRTMWPYLNFWWRGQVMLLYADCEKYSWKIVWPVVIIVSTTTPTPPPLASAPFPTKASPRPVTMAIVARSSYWPLGNYRRQNGGGIFWCDQVKVSFPISVCAWCVCVWASFCIRFWLFYYDNYIKANTPWPAVAHKNWPPL